jgi:hypothetical protein
MQVIDLSEALDPEDEKRLEQLAEGNTPTRVIALRLRRTEDAVRSKASDLDIAFKLTYQSPYSPRKS